jgi:translation initiation factor IF-3
MPGRFSPAIDPISNKLAAYKLDDQIEAEFVQMRQEDGKLSPATRLKTLLSEIRDDEVVLELSPKGQFPDTAVVRVVERQDLLREAARKEQALKDLQKQSKQSRPKQIELNWAISEKDLMMKLNQMADFLDKGKKVEVLLAAKKRQRRASPEEAEAVLMRVRDKIEEVGAKEVKNMEGKVLGQALLTVQK